MNDQTPDHTPIQPSHQDSDPWESEMTSEFDRRVRELNEAPLTIEHVRGTAVKIQRKRRAAVAGGILAAAAVVVPVAILATGSSDDSAPRPDVASQTATDSITPIPSPTESAPPVVTQPSYVEGSTLHLPDGGVYELPSATYDSATLMGSRVVATSRDNLGNVTVEVIEEGAVVDSYAARDGISLDADGDVAAFVTPAGDVQTIWADGEAVLADGYRGWSVRGVSGGPDCLDPEAGGSGCQVSLVDQMRTSEPVVVDSHGIEDNPVPDALDIRDVDLGRYAVINQYDEGNGVCSGVYDSDLGDYAFTTCDFTVVQFSPDGSNVMAFPSQYDGFGPFSISILDATTGTELASISSDDDWSVSRGAWVDEDTIAVNQFSFATQEWRLLEITAGDGEPTVVAGPGPGSDFEPTYRIAGR